VPKALRSSLTFANVMVVLLTFVVFGGGAYAAVQLPKNSVGSKQLKKGAVTRAKINKATMEALRGAQGPTGPAGAAGSAAAAPTGTVPAGVTLRGPGVVGSLSSGVGNEGVISGISFGGAQLAARPIANIVPAGSPPTPSCPGSASAPEATAGNLCFYVSGSAPSTDGIVAVVDPVAGGPSGVIYNLESKEMKSIGGESRVARFGFQLSFSSSTSNSPQLAGSWAVTG
jgi:hypothetical protein